MSAIKGRQVRKMYQEMGGRYASFSTKFRSLLGIKEDPITGKKFVDQASRQMGPEEFSLRELTEAFLGREFIEALHTGMPGGTMMDTLSMALSTQTQHRLLMEEATGVGPTVFQDINAWNATVAGLVEVRLLEAYNAPEFIRDEFMETQPTRVNGGKMIGIPYPAPAADVVIPGVEFPSIGMNELWVWARPNFVYGEKLALDRNTLVYDLGGDLMGKAESLGKGIGYGIEYYCAAQILGLKNVIPASGYPKQSLMTQAGDSFRMNQTIDSTPNTTYQTAGVTTNPNLPNAYNYVNKVTGGAGIVDWTSFQPIRKTLNLARDPVYQLPFNINIKTVWVDPYLWDVTLRVLHATQVMDVTGTPASNYNSVNQGAGSTVPPVFTGSPGFPPGSMFGSWRPHQSNIWHQVLLDAGVSEANAEKYFLAGEPKKAFVWRSAWDMRVDAANPSSSELLGKNIVNEWVAQISGQFVVREPRYVVLSTN